MAAGADSIKDLRDGALLEQEPSGHSHADSAERCAK
jgi:hypothetical protein